MVLDKVADFVLFMGKLLVVIIVTAATFALFSNQVTSTLGNNLGIICTVTSNNIRYPTELPVCPHGHHHPRLLRHRLDLLLGVQHGCGHNISLLLTGLLTVLTHNFSSRQFYFEGSEETRRIPWQSIFHEWGSYAHPGYKRRKGWLNVRTKFIIIHHAIFLFSSTTRSKCQM